MSNVAFLGVKNKRGVLLAVSCLHLADQYQKAILELDAERLFSEISKAENQIQTREAELL